MTYVIGKRMLIYNVTWYLFANCSILDLELCTSLIRPMLHLNTHHAPLWALQTTEC